MRHNLWHQPNVSAEKELAELQKSILAIIKNTLSEVTTKIHAVFSSEDGASEYYTSKEASWLHKLCDESAPYFIDWANKFKPQLDQWILKNFHSNTMTVHYVTFQRIQSTLMSMMFKISFNRNEYEQSEKLLEEGRKIQEIISTSLVSIVQPYNKAYEIIKNSFNGNLEDLPHEAIRCHPGTNMEEKIDLSKPANDQGILPSKLRSTLRKQSRQLSSYKR